MTEAFHPGPPAGSFISHEQIHCFLRFLIFELDPGPGCRGGQGCLFCFCLRDSTCLTRNPKPIRILQSQHWSPVSEFPPATVTHTLPPRLQRSSLLSKWLQDVPLRHRFTTLSSQPSVASHKLSTKLGTSLGLQAGQLLSLWPL